jgi:hypothetical protein
LCIHYKILGNMKQSNQWHLLKSTRNITTCGQAIDVPERVDMAVSLVFHVLTISSPCSHLHDSLPSFTP